MILLTKLLRLVGLLLPHLKNKNYFIKEIWTKLIEQRKLKKIIEKTEP
jgi:hypothetical protein